VNYEISGHFKVLSSNYLLQILHYINLLFFPAEEMGASKDFDFFATVAGTTMTRNVPQQ